MWVLRCRWVLLPVSFTPEKRFLSWRQKFGISIWESLMYSLISLILYSHSQLLLPSTKELRALGSLLFSPSPGMTLPLQGGLQDVYGRQLLSGREPRQLSSSWLGAVDVSWKPWPTSKSPPSPPAHSYILHTEAARLQSAELQWRSACGCWEEWVCLSV